MIFSDTANYIASKKPRIMEYAKPGAITLTGATWGAYCVIQVYKPDA